MLRTHLRRLQDGGERQCIIVASINLNFILLPIRHTIHSQPSSTSISVSDHSKPSEAGDRTINVLQSIFSPTSEALSTF